MANFASTDAIPQDRNVNYRVAKLGNHYLCIKCTSNSSGSSTECSL